MLCRISYGAVCSSSNTSGKATAGIDVAIVRALAARSNCCSEYRTRLIADVVTGKLDVREAAAQLPEERDVEDDSIDEDRPLGDDMEGDLYDIRRVGGRASQWKAR